MATRTKRKAGAKKAVSDQPSAVSQNEAPKLLDVADLSELITDRIYDFQRTHKLDELSERIEKLRRELAEAEAELEYRARPLRDLERAMAAGPSTADDDVDLCRAVSQLTLTLTRRDFSGGYGSEFVEKSTGAVAWPELVARGATDAQIKKNLEHVNDVDSDRYQIARRYPGNGGSAVLVFERRKSRKDQYREVCKGDKLVAEVRRVMGIPLPAGAKAPKPAAATKPAAKKPAKKKQAAKRNVSSARTRSANVSQKSQKRNTSAAPAGKAGSTPKRSAPSTKPRPAVARKRKYPSGAEKRRRRAEKNAAPTGAAAMGPGAKRAQPEPEFHDEESTCAECGVAGKNFKFDQ